MEEESFYGRRVYVIKRKGNVPLVVKEFFGDETPYENYFVVYLPTPDGFETIKVFSALKKSMGLEKIKSRLKKAGIL